jgi:hypothetical protein
VKSPYQLPAIGNGPLSKGGAVDCVIDDGIACTVDYCDPYTGCVHRPDDAVCDDGAFCKGTETCGASGCETVSACPPIVLECVKAR